MTIKFSVRGFLLFYIWIGVDNWAPERGLCLEIAFGRPKHKLHKVWYQYKKAI